jgi:hypothetical protein
LKSGIGNTPLRATQPALFGALLKNPAMGRVLWRVNRLRCMSPAEVAHRSVRAASMLLERCLGAAPAAVPEPDLQRRSQAWVARPTALDTAVYLAAADRIAEGRYDIFALRGAQLGSPPNWNRDPKTGTEAPLLFGKSLDYRDSSLVGDIKYLWEPNRHLHLVTLAQAYALSGELRYFELLREHLDSWFTSCPYGMGPNWASSLEPAIRLINWSVAWQTLGGAASPLFATEAGAAFRDRWLASIYRHVEFIHGHFSLYSSANNHLLGEAAGVFIAAVTWPHWPRTEGWRSKAKRILEREALLQNGPDGVNREQAASYQQFVLDFLLFPLLAGQANGADFSLAYKTRIESMLEYLASIMDVGGHVPAIGDADDALVVRFDPRESFCPYRSLLATGAILFSRGEFKAKAGALDDKSRWLFGTQGDQAFQAVQPRADALPVRRAFPDGGYYILGTDFETADEIRLIADAGPLGYQSIAAHGHADALAFTLSIGGTEFLIDPGTYAYHTQPAWRQYFRGTSAHNTLRLDGQNQSEPGGNFMWLKKAQARCSEWRTGEDADVFRGAHDGYTRLADPAVHERSITLHKQSRRIVIEDRLTMQGEHAVELFFHCSEDTHVERIAGGFAISDGRRTISLSLPAHASGEAHHYRGSSTPLSGWISRRFDERVPCPTIVWQARLSGPVLLRSEIQC